MKREKHQQRFSKRSYLSPLIARYNIHSEQPLVAGSTHTSSASNVTLPSEKDVIIDEDF